MLQKIQTRLRNLPGSTLALNLFVNLQQDYLGLVAAGIAFYFLFAVFPAIGALISLYGIFSDPGFVADQMDALGRFLPSSAIAILSGQARSIAASSEKILGLSFFLSIGLTIYSATKGVNALIQGFNIAYNQPEKRNIVSRNWTAFLLTFVMIVYFLISLSLIAVLPALTALFYLPHSIEELVLVIRWPLLFVMAVTGLEILYYFGPSRPRAKWRWMSYGSFTATLLWVVSSSFFSLFVSHFGKYNETYGSLGAVIILLFWFWLSALTILLGAEINATLEQPDKPVIPTGSR